MQFAYRIVKQRKLKLFKKGAVLINTARGGIIDTHALIHALINKTVAYAGLDVLEGERLINEERELLHSKFTQDLRAVLESSILLRKPNVYITPHNAFNSKEALLRILDATLENISGFARKKPVNLVKA